MRGKRARKKIREPQQYALNKVELAAALGITRQALHEWMRMALAPRADAGGRYHLEEWKAWRDERGLKGSETSGELAEKAKFVRLKNEDLELDIAIKRSEWTENIVLVEEFGRFASEQKKLLRQKIEKELPAKLAGLDLAAARAEGRKLVDEICRRNQAFLVRWKR